MIGAQEGGWSFRVKICPKACSPKVTRPPSKYIHGRWSVFVLCLKH